MHQQHEYDTGSKVAHCSGEINEYDQYPQDGNIDLVIILVLGKVNSQGIQKKLQDLILHLHGWNLLIETEIKAYFRNNCQYCQLKYVAQEAFIVIFMMIAGFSNHQGIQWKSNSSYVTVSLRHIKNYTDVIDGHGYHGNDLEN